MSAREVEAVGARPAWPAWAVVGALVTVVWMAHGGALGGGFHYDDHFAVAANPAVRSWQPTRAFLSADAVINEQQAAGYRPLTVISLALNYRLAGLKPGGYLATNLALHAFAAVLVFLLGLELLGDLRWAAVAGAAFALHPLNAEAVNYVTARSSLLSTVFALAAVWAFVRYAARRGGAWTLVAGLCACVGALLSKESAVALVVPVVAARWLLPVLQSAGPRAMRAAWAYTALAVLFVALFMALTAGGVAPRVPGPRPFWIFAELLGRSLALWVWPWPLGLDHRLTFILRFDAMLAAALVAAALGLVTVFVILVRRAPLAAWGLLWALAGLAPLAPLPWLTSVGLLQEHRMGFSAAGLALMTAALVGAAWTALGGMRARRVVAWGCVGAGVALTVGAVFVDRSRSAVWQDDRLLWEEVVRHWPENMVARINLGAAYMLRGEYERAETEYQTVQARSPGYPRVYYNMGLLALRRGRFEEAKAAFQRVIALNPVDDGAYAHLGILAWRAGDNVSAEAAFRSALRINPTQREALNNLAALYLGRREWSQALDLVTAALQRDPGALEAAYNRGLALAGLGRRAEAEAVLREVRERLPRDEKFDRYRTGIDDVLRQDAP